MSSISVMKDVIVKTLGSSIVTTSEKSSRITYSYIEFSDGQILKDVKVPHFLAGILEKSLENSQPTDLYFTFGKKNIIGAKRSDGRNFIVDQKSDLVSVLFLGIFLFFFGFISFLGGVNIFGYILIPISLMCFMGAWIQNKDVKYFKAVPNVELFKE